jgi:NifU-like protein involved in Fe-S cluster formation
MEEEIENQEKNEVLESRETIQDFEKEEGLNDIEIIQRMIIGEDLEMRTVKARCNMQPMEILFTGLTPLGIMQS